MLLLVPAVPLISSERKLFALCNAKGIKSFSTTLFKIGNQFTNGSCLSGAFLPLALWRGGQGGEAIETLEHLLEGPLCPLVVDRITSANLAVPIETEADLVELTAVSVDVLKGGLLWVLTGLNGILLCRQTVGVIAHGVQNVESLLTLIAGIDITGDISQWMSYMQTCTTGVRKHVENIVFLLVLILNNTIGLLFNPSLLPFLFDVPEIVFHCFIILYFF